MARIQTPPTPQYDNRQNYKALKLTEIKKKLQTLLGSLGCLCLFVCVCNNRDEWDGEDKQCERMTKEDEKKKEERI